MDKQSGFARGLIHKIKWWCMLFKLYCILKYHELKKAPEFYPAIIAFIAILINIIILILLIKK